MSRELNERNNTTNSTERYREERKKSAGMHERKRERK
jgi:hypothetical protein